MLRFDGFYVATLDDDETSSEYRQYVRFYQDGTVIVVSSEGTPSEVREWFDRDHHNVSRGKYRLEAARLSFRTAMRDGRG